MKNIEQQTLSAIAMERPEIIPVFEKYNLDFCCGGKKTLSDACTDKKLNLTNVKEELLQSAKTTKSVMAFKDMNAEQLTSYIIINHHFYVRDSTPKIINHLQKLIDKHAEKYPYLLKVLKLFTQLKQELYPHMQREENILFPRLKEIWALKTQHINVGQQIANVNSVLEVTQDEHDNAGRLMSQIRAATNNYTAPQGACTTHSICMEELKFFERDLHQHVHLENNVVFPMAIAEN